MKTILVTAYAVNPYKGSEDGMGWNFIQQLAQEFKVIAITRNNNLPHIQRYMEAFPSATYSNIQFVGFDLSKAVLFWKKGEMGALAYFYLWQRAMPGFIRQKGFEFDLCHNLNFHNDWTPSFLWKLNKPFIWGPIGHHPLIPAAFVKNQSKKDWIKDRMRWMIKQAFWKFSPSLRQCADRADLILAMNSEVQEVLACETSKMKIMPSVGCETPATIQSQDNNTFSVISVGRFVSLKGFDLTIKAFAQFVHQLPAHQHAKLRLVGKGDLLPQMEAWIAKLGISDFVEIIHWVERDQLAEMYANSDVFLFPSHEGAGMVVAEAMSYGLPVVCLDNCGPGEFISPDSGISVPYGTYDDTVAGLADALHQLHEEPSLQKILSEGAKQRFTAVFDWEEKGKQLRAYCHKVLTKETTTESPSRHENNYRYTLA